MMIKALIVECILYVTNIRTILTGIYSSVGGICILLLMFDIQDNKFQLPTIVYWTAMGAMSLLCGRVIYPFLKVILNV